MAACNKSGLLVFDWAFVILQFQLESFSTQSDKSIKMEIVVYYVCFPIAMSVKPQNKCNEFISR